MKMKIDTFLSVSKAISDVEKNLDLSIQGWIAFGKIKKELLDKRDVVSEAIQKAATSKPDAKLSVQELNSLLMKEEIEVEIAPIKTSYIKQESITGAESIGIFFAYFVVED
jgi:hypothetical protein